MRSASTPSKALIGISPFLSWGAVWRAPERVEPVIGSGDLLDQLDFRPFDGSIRGRKT